MIGRRANYLHPVRMYVFTSAIFFLFFFSLFKPKDAVNIKTDQPLDSTQRANYIISLQNKLEKDTGNKVLLERIALLKDTGRKFTAKDILENQSKNGLQTKLTDKDYRTFEEYDSTQQTLPSAKRDGWLLRQLIKRSTEIKNKYRENPQEAITKLVEGFFHRLPYLLFVSLPLFALILKLVYIRRKQFYFADHGVFTIHLYVFSFIVLLVAFGLDKLQGFTSWNFIDTINILLFIGLTSYLYIAMHNFYKQGWGKTGLKFFLVAILSLIMMIILLTIFLLFSAATI